MPKQTWEVCAYHTRRPFGIFGDPLGSRHYARSREIFRRTCVTIERPYGNALGLETANAVVLRYCSPRYCGMAAVPSHRRGFRLVVNKTDTSCETVRDAHLDILRRSFLATRLPY